MVDHKYSTDNFKSLKVSIGAIIKNPEMIKFACDHLKTKKSLNMHLKNCHS